MKELSIIFLICSVIAVSIQTATQLRYKHEAEMADKGLCSVVDNRGFRVWRECKCQSQ